MKILQKILEENIYKEVSKLGEVDETVLEDRINKYVNSIPELADKISVIVKKSLDKQAASMLRNRRHIRKGFEKRHTNLWKKGFDLLETFIVLSYEAGEDINSSHRKNASKSNDYVFEVLTRLHARSVQIAYEVLSLLQSGFADGAHARWRTMHELCVVGLFIQKHGQETAKRYLLHEAIESYKAMLQYQEFCERLNQEPISTDIVTQITSTKNILIERYGKQFGDQYGWAYDVINKNPKFCDIESGSGLEYLRPYYRMASHNVHANSKGIKFKLGLSDEMKDHILLSGPSNYGLADPAIGIVRTLLQINSTLLNYKTNVDNLVLLKILIAYQTEIEATFIETNNMMK